jgi:hypothetical protein
MSCIGCANTKKQPPLFLIGAMKCGTTGLHDELMNHPLFHKGTKPQGGMKWMQKELHFFDSDNCSNPEEALAKYETRLPSVPAGHVVVDGTPAYFHIAQYVPSRIRRVYRSQKPNLKFVLMLRDPVDRAISHWNFVQLKVRAHDCADHVEGTKQLDNPKDHTHMGCWSVGMAQNKNLTSLIAKVSSNYEFCIRECKKIEMQSTVLSATAGVVVGSPLREGGDPMHDRQLGASLPPKQNGGMRGVNHGDVDPSVSKLSGVNPNMTRRTAACLERCSAVHGSKPSGIIMRGMYGTTLKQWLHYFEPEQFCIVSYNHFASKDLSKVRALLNIIGNFTLGAERWTNYEWPEPAKKNPSVLTTTTPPGAVEFNAARVVGDMEGGGDWPMHPPQPPSAHSPRIAAAESQLQADPTGDLEVAKRMLAKFYEQGGRLGLYKELEKQGHLGCGTDYPLPSVHQPDADLFYGP